MSIKLPGIIVPKDHEEEEKKLPTFHTKVGKPPHLEGPTSFGQTESQDQNSPWNPLNPNADSGKKETWEEKVEAYLNKTKEDFVNRISKGEPSEEDLEMLVSTLEESAADGVTFDNYIGKWGLLGKEYTMLAKTVPRFARAAKVAKNLRKASLHNSVSARLLNNPTAALKALENDDLFGDDFLREDEDYDTMALDKKIEAVLMEKGVNPCQYAQVVYFDGDLPSENYEAQDEDFMLFGLGEETVAKMLHIGGYNA